MALKNLTGIESPAVADLQIGLGGALQDQVAGETEEQRKKRMLAMRGIQPDATGSLAAPALFGAGYAGI